MQLPVPITQDHGIFKLVIEQGDPCKVMPSYKKGSLALVQYVVHTVPLKASGNKEMDQENIFKSGTAIISVADMIKPQQCTEACCNNTDDYDHEELHIDVTRRCKVGSTGNEPLEVHIGYGLSFSGLEIALKTMRIGEVSKFVMTPAYAEQFIQMESSLRRAKRKDDHVHASKGNCCLHLTKVDEELFKLYGCALEFQLTLVDVKEPGAVKKEIWQMSGDEQRLFLNDLKATADTFYKSGKYLDAQNSYQKGLALCSHIETALTHDNAQVSIDDIPDIKRLIQSNLAATKLKLGDYKSVVEICTKLLELNQDDVKSRFRRAQAFIGNGDLESAENDLMYLSCNVKHDIDIRKELAKLAEKKLLFSQQEKRMFHGIFN